MSGRYEQLYDGEWFRPVKRGFFFQCCDCGFTHRMDFRVVHESNRLLPEFRVFVDSRRTAARRRRGGLEMAPARRDR